VLLAAAIQARPGERVLEAGTGCGATLLCLAARVPGIAGLGLDSDPELAGLASRNAAANGCAGLTFRAVDLLGAGLTEQFEHACANPPWHAAEGTASPFAARNAAKRATPGLLSDWIHALARAVRDRGTLTLILPARALPGGISALAAAGCGPTGMFPFWPRQDVAAKLLLVRGVKGGRAAFAVAPGLPLHQERGGFTPQAEAVLRQGSALAW
jgi:tRNA1Val (adenine37-N6)-methyltransferase